MHQHHSPTNKSKLNHHHQNRKKCSVIGIYALSKNLSSVEFYQKYFDVKNSNGAAILIIIIAILISDLRKL